jgi:hypothetical protein
VAAPSVNLKRALWATIVVVGLLSGLHPPSAIAHAQVGSGQESGQVAKVWVNTRSGVYHCPGSRYYGSTKFGTLMSESEARSRGYRAAYGRACSPSLSTRDSLPAPRHQAPPPQPGTKVWVNTSSGVYHCPGTRYYGATKRGEFMLEGEAISRGYRPAYGRACR